MDRGFNSNGVPIHYTVRGEGEPVLLIHGFARSLEETWEGTGIIDALEAAGYRAIAFDVRGHGRSGKPHDPAMYGSEASEDAVRLLDHLGVGRAHIVGYSLGGNLTHRLRYAHPDRFVTATFGGVGWSPETPDATPIAEALQRGTLEPLVRILSPVGQPEPTDAEIRAASDSVLADNDPLALAALVRGGFVPSIPDWSLRENEIPALALVGELDPMRGQVDVMAGVMKNLEVVVIPGTHHTTARTDPRFVEHLLAFLARHQVASPP